jgi:hypothetical protein
VSAARTRVVRSSRLPALEMGRPVRSLLLVGRPWGQAGERSELGGVGEALGGAHGGGQGGAADLGQAWQAAGQAQRVDPAVAVLALGGVAVQLGLGGPQQADLGVHLGGQIGDGHRGVVAGQLHQGAGGGKPRRGPVGVLVAV